MIKRGGGRILTREPKPSVSDVCMVYSSPDLVVSSVPSPSTLVYHARPDSSQYTCTQYVLYDSSTGKKPRVAHTFSVCTAPVSWLMDCISHFEILDVPPLPWFLPKFALSCQLVRTVDIKTCTIYDEMLCLWFMFLPGLVGHLLCKICSVWRSWTGLV